LTLPLHLSYGLIHNKRVAYPPEVSPLAKDGPYSIADSIREARAILALELRAQAEQIQKLTLDLTELQQLQERAEQQASRQWDEVTRVAELAAAAQVSADTVLENVLNAVRGLMICTMPEQVFATLTEEASQWGVRAAIFDVRGKVAWGASAHGFGPALSEKVLRALIIPLNQDTPFRQVYETAGHVDASAETLRKNRNLLDKLKPAPHAPILLLPIRSAGTVAAIFYADSGEEAEPLPVDALKILAEFAGAQIDRLIALSGGFQDEVVKEDLEEPVAVEAPAEEAPVEAAAEVTAAPEPPANEPGQAASLAVEATVEGVAAGEPVVRPMVAEAPAEVEIPGPLVPATETPAPPAQTAVEPPQSAEIALEPPAPPAEMAAPEPPRPVEASLRPPEPVAPAVESVSAPPFIESPGEVLPSPPPVELPPPAPEAGPGIAVAQPSEAELKIQKDAMRFAKLLVSEIELYNKAKVAEGRKNGDLYKRLKADIDRSRQTFEKRFGKTLSKQTDYFHDELVRILAANDSTVLGPDYPGPSL
jgi:hypothetical protein